MAFIGLMILIGTKKMSKTNLCEIFAADGTGIEISRGVMSMKRFIFLLTAIRFDDPQTREERKRIDKLAAIRTFFNSFVENCKQSYSLGEFITIDEKLEPYRGRCSFIQYIPNKPAKYGLKIYALVDAKSSYTHNLEIYCGKQPEGPYAISNSPSEVVYRLVAGLEHSNRNLTCDNWYSSCELAKTLLEKGLTFIGTLRKNKKEIPLEFLPDRSRAPGTSIFGFQKI